MHRAFALLCTGVVKLRHVELAADFLLKHLVFFFVPVALGLMEWRQVFYDYGLRLSAAIGCRFVQPTVESVSAETFKLCRELGLRPNLFVCDSAELARKLVGMGATGLMTNRIVELGSVFRQP